LPDPEPQPDPKPPSKRDVVIATFSRPVHGHTPAKARAGTVKWFGGRFAEAVGSSSHLTPRWRGESAANSSLKMPKFPASRENTGNFVRLGLRVRLLARNQ
jgi:hypothetical protein